MIRIHGLAFLGAQEVLVQASILLRTNRVGPMLSDGHRNSLIEHIYPLIEQLRDAGMDMCGVAAERLVTAMRSDITVTQALHHIEELRGSILDQITTTYLLNLSLSERELFDPQEPLFGNDVKKAFPLASDDISEAGKCLGLSRPTASVFHLMRAMERAVQAVCDALSITHAEREWGKLLSDIGRSIESMPKGKVRDKWSENLSLLYHVKQAWRNNTMHPKQTYSEREAQTVFDATRAFMIDLADLVG